MQASLYDDIREPACLSKHMLPKIVVRTLCLYLSFFYRIFKTDYDACETIFFHIQSFRHVKFII